MATRLTIPRLQHLRRLNRLLEARASRVDATLLQSALDAPLNQAHYSRATDAVRLAAVLGGKVVLNHAFANGNKRTALLAANAFLLGNGAVVAARGGAEGKAVNEELARVCDGITSHTAGQSHLEDVFRRAWTNST